MKIMNPSADDKEILRTVFEKGVRMGRMQEQSKPLTLNSCRNPLVFLWMEKVLTDAEYYRIEDRLMKRIEEQGNG